MLPCRIYSRGEHCVKCNMVYTLSGDMVYNFMSPDMIFEIIL